MARTTYSFQIDEIDIIDQRSATGDTDADVVQLYLTSSADPTDKVASPPSVIGTFISSGNKFGDQFPGTTDGIAPLVVSTTIGDDDMVQLYATAYNFSHQGDAQREVSDDFKVAAAVLAFAAAGSALLTWKPVADDLKLNAEKLQSVLGPAANVLSLTAGVIEGIADLLDVFASPNCDGYVFNQQIATFMTAKFLSEKTGNKVGGSFTFDLTDDSQQSPSKCGHNPVTKVTYRVTATNIIPDLPPLLGGAGRTSKAFKALVGHDIAGWTGVWADQAFIESSRVVCNLDAPPGTKALPLDVLKAKTQHTAAFAQLIGRSPSERDQTMVSATAGAPAPGGAPVVPISTIVPLARVDVTEKLDGPNGNVAAQVAHERMVDVPMGAAPFATNIFPEVVHVDPGLLQNVQITGANEKTVKVSAGAGALLGRATFTPTSAPSGSRATTAAGGATAVNGVGGVSGVAGGESGLLDFGLHFADTLALSDGVCLQLYGGFDESGFVENRLRYVRVDVNGNIVTDVMLQRAQHTPR